MKTSTLAALAAAAVGVAGAAWLVARWNDAGGRAAAAAEEGAGGAVFPALQKSGAAIGSIEVRLRGGGVTVTHQDGVWKLAERSGYPVNEDHVRAVVRGLAGLRIIEAKTSRPEMYEKIGVQDLPEGEGDGTSSELAAGTSPTVVTVKDPSGAVLAAAILGTQRFGPPPQVFVRRVGEAQSWLAEGKVDVPRDPMGWVERQILNIGRDRIRSVVFSHPDGEVVRVSRAAPSDSSFVVSDVPEGRELTSPKAGDPLAGLLGYLSMDDVASADREDLTEPGGATPGAVVEFTTFDGLVIIAETFAAGGGTWVRFEASVDESVRPVPAEGEGETSGAETRPLEEVRKEVEDLNKKLAGWAFRLPAYKATQFDTRMEGLLKPPTAAAPAQTQQAEAEPKPEEPESSPSEAESEPEAKSEEPTPESSDGEGEPAADEPSAEPEQPER